MKKQIYEINSDGFISEIYVGEFDENGTLIYPKGIFVTVDLPQPTNIYKPKWDGAKWVEGATQEEIDEITKPQLTPPTLEQRIADLENTILTLLEVL